MTKEEFERFIGDVKTNRVMDICLTDPAYLLGPVSGTILVNDDLTFQGLVYYDYVYIYGRFTKEGIISFSDYSSIKNKAFYCGIIEGDSFIGRTGRPEPFYDSKTFIDRGPIVIQLEKSEIQNENEIQSRIDQWENSIIPNFGGDYKVYCDFVTQNQDFITQRSLPNLIESNMLTHEKQCQLKKIRMPQKVNSGY